MEWESVVIKCQLTVWFHRSVAYNMLTDGCANQNVSRLFMPLNQAPLKCQFNEHSLVHRSWHHRTFRVPTSELSSCNALIPLAVASAIRRNSKWHMGTVHYYIHAGQCRSIRLVCQCVTYRCHRRLCFGCQMCAGAWQFLTLESPPAFSAC